MPWFIWIPLVALGLLCVGCFARSYAHLRADASREAQRSVLDGPLIPQRIFTEKGSRLRLWGWAWACCAMGVLILWGLIAED